MGHPNGRSRDLQSRRDEHETPRLYGKRRLHPLVDSTKRRVVPDAETEGLGYVHRGVLPISGEAIAKRLSPSSPSPSSERGARSGGVVAAPAKPVRSPRRELSPRERRG